MKRIDRLREQLRDVISKRNEAVKGGRYTALAALTRKERELREQITEAEEYEPKRLSKLIDRKTLYESGLCELMIEMHMAADFLADCAMALEDKLKKFGLHDCSIFRQTHTIFDESQKFANSVCHPQFADLSGFLSTNEELIDSAHELFRDYLADHLMKLHKERETNQNSI